jgi:hypothetical protein
MQRDYTGPLSQVSSLLESKLLLNLYNQLIDQTSSFFSSNSPADLKSTQMVNLKLTQMVDQAVKH